MILHSSSVEETQRFGSLLGTLLQPGDFVGLTGRMGAGKTHFVRGVALGLGVPAEALVSSPTFALVNTYAGGRLPLHHADLYRLRDAEELYDTGFHDLVAQDALMLAEWIDRVPEAAPPDWLELTLLPDGTRRTIHVVAHGPRAEALASQWASAVAG